MRTIFLLLLLFTLASGVEEVTCFTVQLQSNKATQIGLKNLSLLDVPEGCDIFHVDDYYALRCGCEEERANAEERLPSLKKYRQDALIISTTKALQSSRQMDIFIKLPKEVVVQKPIKTTKVVLEQEMVQEIPLVLKKEKKNDFLQENSQKPFKTSDTSTSFSTDYCLGVNIGYARLNYKVLRNSSLIKNSPSIDYYNYELYLLVSGLFIEDKSYKTSLNYIYSYNQKLSNHIMMMGVSKYLEYDHYNLYAGVLAGVGMLNWKYTPLELSKNEDFKAFSWVAAFEIGAEYPLFSNLFLGISTKYYLHDYRAKIQPVNSISSEIQHQKSFSINMGVRYLLF